MDLDGTLISGCSSIFLLRELMKSDEVNHEFAQRALNSAEWKQRGLPALRGGIYRNLPLAVKGCPPALMAEAADRAWPELAKTMFPFAQDLVKTLHSHHYTVFLMTGAMWQMAAHVAEMLHIDVCVGAVLEVRDRVFTGELTRAPARTGEKSHLVKSWARSQKIDLTESMAMGNGIRDAEMMELVGKPVAFEPEYDLAPIARRYSWPIVDQDSVLPLCETLVLG